MTNSLSWRWESRHSQSSHVQPEQVEDEGTFGLPLRLAKFNRDDISTILPKNARVLHDEIHAVSSAVPELITTVMISTTSVATQCLFDVEYLDMIRCPTSISAIYVSGSGSRKSRVNDELTQAHSDFQIFESEGLLELHEAEADKIILKAKKRDAVKEIQENIHNPEKLLEARNRFIELSSFEQSTAKNAANIMHRDVSYAALARSIESQSACTSWINPDATTILPQLGRMMPQFCLLWDGAAIQRERMTTESVFQSEPRMAVSWGMQTKRFKAYVKEHGADFIDVGMGARTLIAMCRPIPPQRNPRRVKVVREARDRHSANISRILERYAKMLRSGDIKRTILTLADSAEEQFRTTLAWIEENRAEGGYLSNIPEFANRMPENILRIASNLHVIEQREGNVIQRDILLSAIRLIIFFTEQHIALFGDINTPLEEKYARAVLDYLRREFEKYQVRETPWTGWIVTVRQIQQYVGNAEIRSKRDYVVEALYVLAREGIVRLHFGPGEKVISVQLLYSYFGTHLTDAANLDHH
ncbi:DUF3987 domain-containing protein [Ralstonia pseudosolanacearum]|uniref:DUF3987 domain-containing protein n=1 Tax=Ralstonia pseudosolanacearum TaxID=1310165 RepID=UPI003D2EAF1C